MAQSTWQDRDLPILVAVLAPLVTFGLVLLANAITGSAGYYLAVVTGPALAGLGARSVGTIGR